jgi:vanillate O-demethylase monooxygenase subunit
MAHFPFVHRATFGADEAAEVPAYRLDRDRWAFTVSYEHSFSNREDPAVAEGTRPLLQHRRLTYRYDAPFHLVLRIEFLEAGGSNVIGFFLQPETADSCRLYTTLWRDDLDGDTGRMAEAVAFEKAVLDEDLAIQTAFDRLVLPLERTTELHTRADRSTLELRRVLAELVEAAEAG